MPESPHPAPPRGRFAVLFGLALALHLAIPLLDDFKLVDTIVGLAFLVVLSLGGWVTLERRGPRVAYSVGLAASLISTLNELRGEELVSHATWLSLHAAAFGLIAVLLTRWTLTRPRVTVDTIFAALSAYYLMGVTWALGYALTDSLAPGSFTAPLTGNLQDPLYFSFVTLTTLGYGDLSPVHPVARALVSLEALVGQVFLVVLVARLVSLQIAHAPDPQAGPIPEPDADDAG